MKEERWWCKWGGHEIAVEDQGSGIRFQRRLIVDGQVVDEEGVASMRDLLRRPHYLCARVPLDGESRIIEAAVGRCRTGRSFKFYVDGEQVGGPKDLEFVVPEPLRWKVLRAPGRARYVLRQALLMTAPVIVVLMAMKLVVDGSWTRAILVVIPIQLLFAATSADGRWGAAETLYQFRERKLAGLKWEEPPEIPSARRVVSLVLISAGVFVCIIGALVATVILAEVESLLSPVMGFLVIPLVVMAVGVALILIANRLRVPRASSEHIEHVRELGAAKVLPGVRE